MWPFLVCTGQRLGAIRNNLACLRFPCRAATFVTKYTGGLRRVVEELNRSFITLRGLHRDILLGSPPGRYGMAEKYTS